MAWATSPMLQGYATASISHCSGPHGEVLFTDRTCPEGYVLEKSIESSIQQETDQPLFDEGTQTLDQEEEQVIPPTPSKQEPLIDEVCRNGQFITDNYSIAFDVYFINRSSRDCQSVNVYCRYQLSFGLYRQSTVFQYSGLLKSGKKRKIGRVTSTGPAGRDLDWSWCGFK